MADGIFVDIEMVVRVLLEGGGWVEIVPGSLRLERARWAKWDQEIADYVPVLTEPTCLHLVWIEPNSKFEGSAPLDSLRAVVCMDETCDKRAERRHNIEAAERRHAERLLAAEGR